MKAKKMRKLIKKWLSRVAEKPPRDRCPACGFALLASFPPQCLHCGTTC